MSIRDAIFRRIICKAILAGASVLVLSFSFGPLPAEAHLHRHSRFHREIHVFGVPVASHSYGARHFREARRHFGLRRRLAEERPVRAKAHLLSHSANIAAIIVDANSGQTLYARNENDLRHPASITKVMTLYLLFEQLEQGRLRLDSRIPVSAHAAAQKPTKLGLRPGQTISVEDAIGAVVTRSANDIAVAIAEAIGGSEDRFAGEMTERAHALGMSHTHFANASGLPNDEQITTARDLSILGRAIQDRFPRYYHYFSTRVFYYAGHPIPNHNHLMERMEGMDGIKTGYTQASGFNLLSSVKRDGHYIIGVVLGGSSAASRDRIMEHLIDAQIDSGSITRTAAAITEHSPALPPSDGEIAAVSPPASFPSRTAWVEPSYQAAPSAGDMDQTDQGEEPEPDTAALAPIARSGGIAPLEQKPQQGTGAKFLNRVPQTPEFGRTKGIEVASLDPQALSDKPRPAYISSAPKPGTASGELELRTRPRASSDGSTARTAKSFSPATPSNLRKSRAQAIAALIEEAPEKPAEPVKSSSGHGAWVIQVGATENAGEAEKLLNRAKSEGRKALRSARPFTEKVKKGSETLYRARFAGLEEDSAESACKTLKRSGFSCFATKN